MPEFPPATRDIIRSIITDGGAGAEITLAPNESARMVKQNFNKIAKRFGYRVEWLSAEERTLCFRLVYEGGGDLSV